MSLTALVAAGRAAEEARMLSRCTLRRKTGRMAQNEDTGAEYPIWAVLATDLPLRLADASNSTATSTQSVPGGQIQVARRMAHLPVVTIPRDGDYIEITAGENTGLVLVIIEADWSDQKTARRVPVDAVQRPEEWS